MGHFCGGATRLGGTASRWSWFAFGLGLVSARVSAFPSEIRSAMFERYTEKARRVIFFARYEASQFGSPYIETEHILLGLMREDKALTNKFLRAEPPDTIRQQIERNTVVREHIATSVDLPLSEESKRVLAYAAEEAERLRHQHIGTEHLLLGLLREESSFAANILHERGLRLATMREEVAHLAASGAVQTAAWGGGSNSGVFIYSNPPGAEIEVDGLFVGQTPAQLPLETGERRIKVSLRGYRAWERALHVLHGARQTVVAELESE